MVADGVEVEVEAGLAGVEAQGSGPAGQGFEQGEVGGSAHPVGVAGEVGGLGQSGQAEHQAEPGVGAEGEGVGGPAPPGALEQQQRGERVERGQHLGSWVVDPGDQPGDAELDEGGRQQVQPGVVTLPAGAGRPVGDRPGLQRLEAGGRPGRAAPFETFDALGVQDRPHRLGRHRAALGRQDRGDVGDRAVLGSQGDHPVAHPAGLAGTFRSGFGGPEELAAPRPQLGGELVDRRRRVVEPATHLRGGQLVDEVGPQSLVAALRGLTR